jgi:predicted peptidase
MWRLVFTMSLLAGETGFLDRQVTVNGEKRLYQVYVPREYSGEREWPVILFLHGSGESGRNGITQTLIGLPAAIRKNPERFPAIVVMPQALMEKAWMEAGEQDVALAALDATQKEYKTDRARVYLTGLSKGGFGTWHLAARAPERFAAMAPVCGGIVPTKRALERMGKTAAEVPTDAELAKKIGAGMPAWVFHGGADPTVPVEASRTAVAALKELGSGVKYTEYEGVGHNSWDKAYGDAAFAEWLFQQRRER